MFRQWTRRGGTSCPACGRWGRVMHRRLPSWLGIVLGCGIAGTAVIASQKPDAATPGPSASGTKIVFLAGPKDHGADGRHEYEKDLRGLATALTSAPNLKGIRTDIYVGKAPRDPAV